MSQKRIVIMGATSGIGHHAARLFAEAGWKVGIAGRRIEKLESLRKEFPEQIATSQIDITTESATEELLNLIERLGGMDTYLHVSGIGFQNHQLVTDIELNIVRTNAVGFTRMIDTAYGYLASHGGGHIAAISSIAGTRGLGSAPAYSATKRYQNCYIDSLAQLSRMNRAGITFTDIRPGFVGTALLSDGESYPMLMSVEKVARKVFRAVSKHRRRVVIDWRYGVLVALWRMIPQWLWERLRFVKTAKKR